MKFQFTVALSLGTILLVSLFGAPDTCLGSGGGELNDQGIHGLTGFGLDGGPVSAEDVPVRFDVLWRWAETVQAGEFNASSARLPALGPVVSAPVRLLAETADDVAALELGERGAALLETAATRIQYLLVAVFVLGALIVGLLISGIRARRRMLDENATINADLERQVAARSAELKEAWDELLRSERLAALGQLTATVSHELRNPLGTIQTSIYAIDGKTRGRGLGVEQALDRAERSIVRCADIVEELLEFTRVRELARQPTAIDPWIDDMLSDYTLPAGIELRLALESGAECSIDRERLRRVMINLADNACQAMTEDDANEAAGEHVLTVRSTTAGGRLEIVVSDTGRGMPAEVLERVFEPLFTTKSFGVGLGLPMVKQIVEQHGGEISIVSEQGSGTRVVFWLSLSREERRMAQ